MNAFARGKREAMRGCVEDLRILMSILGEKG